MQYLVAVFILLYLPVIAKYFLFCPQNHDLSLTLIPCESKWVLYHCVSHMIDWWPVQAVPSCLMSGLNDVYLDRSHVNNSVNRSQSLRK